MVGCIKQPDRRSTFIEPSDIMLADLIRVMNSVGESVYEGMLAIVLDITCEESPHENNLLLRVHTPREVTRWFVYDTDTVELLCRPGAE